MMKTSIGLSVSVFVLLAAAPVHAATMQASLAFTENSATDLTLAVNGQDIAVTMVSPDHWVVDLGLGTFIARPIVVSFREPNPNEGWNVVSINSTSTSVSSDQPAPSGLQLP